jgi:HrpA-like RNA helicase
MLLRESIVDRKLQKYSILILDEVHERSLNSDTILALAKDLINSGKRNDLKLIVMSATLSVDKFANYLNSNNILFIEGRSFPIEIYNTINKQKTYLVKYFI